MSHIATIGFFDGVHVGHQYVFSHLQEEARARQLSPLIITFSQHPREVLQDGYVPELLTDIAERKALLEQYAPTVMFDFKQVYQLTAQEFMRYLHEQYDVRVILMGYDHHFGCDRLATSHDYALAGKSIGVEIKALLQYKPQVDSAEDGLPQHVSSTEIRSLLHTGDIVCANELLGYAYTLYGTVVHGNEIGRKIGFPTANITPRDPHKLIPKEGVYQAEVNIDGLWKKGVLNIGKNPTVGNKQQTIEVYIIDYEGDIYGSDIQVRLLKRLRDEHHFDSLSALKEQIAKDIALCGKG